MLPARKILGIGGLLLTIPMLFFSIPRIQVHDPMVEYNNRSASVLLLWWTSWPWWGYKVQGFAGTCEASHGFTCTISSDRKRLNESDALVFNDWELFKSDLPASSDTGGPKWVYFQTESPLYTRAHLTNFNSTFHWTMTYRRGSDIPYPYGSFALGTPSELTSVPPPIVNRSKLVAWMASSCDRPSRRGDIVEEMKTFIPIDIYGKCGPFKCPRWTEVDCYVQLALEYKFYLAFENSLCEDYLTEKAWEALKVGMVPIVYGGADYAALLPPHSFIDITTFHSLKDLTDYILFLDTNPDEYMRYFEWRKTYIITVSDAVWNRAFCELCGRLLKERESGAQHENSKIEDLDAFWNGYTGRKRRAPEFLVKYIQDINNPKVPACDLFRTSKANVVSYAIKQTILFPLLCWIVMCY